MLGQLFKSQVKEGDNGHTEISVKKQRVLIGVAGFHGVIPECQENFFALAYRCGRDFPQYDFLLKIMIKREQFRARNNLVDLAITNGCDYLLMLDDDMVVPPDLFNKLVTHDKDVIGALYYQRGGSYHPVIMKQINKKDGLRGINFIHHFDPMIQQPGLYQLDGGVIGGGCLLFKTDVFRKIEQPYFWVDGIVGTDVHICDKLTQAGVPLWVDTSIELGHVGEAVVITSRNIPKHNKELDKAYEDFWGDLKHYFQVNDIQLESMLLTASSGNAREVQWGPTPRTTWEEVRAYYQAHGDWQILNMAAYNLRYDEARALTINNLGSLVKPGAHVVDVGCGNGFVCVPLVEKYGVTVTAMDVQGVPTMAFLTHRIQRHHLEQKITTIEFADPVPPDLSEPADVALMISMFDHLYDPMGMLDWAARNVKVGGWLICDSWRCVRLDREPQHLLKFDPQTVEREFKKRGFALVPESTCLFKKEG